MIASHAATGTDTGSSPGAVRAHQLIEAGLWLRLGGDEEGARRLFVRALAHDRSNRRAREWLVKSNTVRTAVGALGVPPSAVLPVSAAPSAPLSPVRPVRTLEPVEPQPVLEVSVVLLDEGMVAAPRSASPMGEFITADVLDFLAEEPEAHLPPPPPAPRVDPRQEVARLLQGVEELLLLGDPDSALELLGKAEALAPGEPRLAGVRVRCARAQQAAWEAKLGDLKRVPQLKLRMAELMRLSLEPRAGFLLSRIDGRLSFEALFAVSGMSRPDTLRFLAQLLDQGIITVR